MKITIVYNPNSTGDSKANASLARDQLSAFHEVDLVATNFAGHAEELARSIAGSGDEHLIISSSGDGGYHEIINGILSAGEDSNAIAGLLPSGNANDHYRMVHRGDLLERINQRDIDYIDVLEVSTSSFTRYAHSYAGLGVTAQIVDKLNRVNLNRFNETWIVGRNLFNVTPIKLRYKGRVSRYHSVLFTNIGAMSKVLTINKMADPRDGKFEITARRARSLLALIRHLLKAALVGLDTKHQADFISFTMLSSSSIQLDGEVYQLAKGEQVAVRCLKRRVATII